MTAFTLKRAFLKVSSVFSFFMIRRTFLSPDYKQSQPSVKFDKNLTAGSISEE